MAYISRLTILKREIEKRQNVIIICERSVWTDRNVFAKMLYDDKKIELVNYDIYNRWFDEFVKQYPLNGIIYVKTDPEICQNRIGIRAREGETIPIEYSVKCHNYHENWINNSSCDTLILDGNAEFINKLPSDWNDKIISFMETKTPVPDYVNNNWDEILAC
jgi:deoxyadenosine/deoxycytidine kinase